MMMNTTAPSSLWKIRNQRVLDLSKRCLLMGILNVTPDSFSDGGLYAGVDRAVARAEQMLTEGADIIDVGGQSTRPGRKDGSVTPEEEVARVVPVLKRLRQKFPEAILSLDTFEPLVLEAGIEVGVDILNDITGLRHGGEKMAELAGQAGLGVVLMHMQGTPETMQIQPEYGDVTVEVTDFLRERLRVVTEAGVSPDHVAVDPGIGFGKTDDHNLQLLAGLEYLRLLQRPILVGASRKGFLARLTDPQLQPEQRDHLSLVVHTAAVLHGATIIRSHDVRHSRQALELLSSLRRHM